MTVFLFVYLAVGGAVGAILGYFGKCSSGACPLTANWRRGAIVGAGMGLALFFAAGRGGSAAMNESTANVKHITANEFEAEVAQAASPVLVDFYATWCGPCKALSPRVDKVASEFSGKIKFVKVNVDESPALAQRFGIEGIPTLLLFKNGKVVDTLVGLQSEAGLKTHLEAALADNRAPRT